MSNTSTPLFAARGAKRDIETGTSFQPLFDADGLISVIVTDKRTGNVVMFAHMNADALRATLQTGIAHFWSRSRAKLWKKGEDSGNTLRVVEIRTDCDQDALWMTAEIAGAGVACHTGSYSCFYRRLAWAGDGNQTVTLQDAALPENT